MTKARTVFQLLVVSLCFNGFFVVGALLRQFDVLPPPPPHGQHFGRPMLGDMIAQRLGLTPVEAEAMRGVFSQMNDSRGKFSPQVDVAMRSVWGESIQDNPDMNKIKATLAEIGSMHTDEVIAMHERLVLVLRTFPIERRKKIAERFLSLLQQGPHER